jgi:adenosylcobinamide-GDP ribazoletransferase
VLRPVDAVAEPRETTYRDLPFELWLAIATLTLWPLIDERRCGAAGARARAMAFAPVVGLALGIALAAIDRALAAALAPAARSLAVVCIGAIATGGVNFRGLGDSIDALRLGARPAATGIARMSPRGALAAAAAFALDVWCLARIGDPAGRAAAIVMALMLSRWTMVPVGYGLKPLERWGLGVPYEGGLTFREFAIASVIALAIAMGLYRNVGLVVIVVLALAILAMRLALSRRLGGAPGFSLAGAAALAELITFAIMSALGA